MKNKASLKIIIILSLIILLSFNIVSAWGVMPAKQLAEFTQQEQDLSVTIKNNNFDEGFFKVSFAGDLADYINYDNSKLLHISPSDSELVIPFKLKLQAGLIPGKNVAKVILQQVPDTANEQTVSSVLTLVAEVVVNVPYKGNYILAQVKAGNSGTEENVPFTISLLNKGEGPVNVWIDVTIKGPTNQPLANWETPKQVLGYLASNKIETSWKGKKEPGVYFAELVVHYNDKVQVLRKEFVVGKEEVTITKIFSDKFSLGEINKLLFTAKNKWNSALKDVFAEVFVLTKDGQTVQTIKSNPENFGPYETKELTAYWDTSKLVVGDYILQAMVHTSSSTTQGQFPVSVSMNKLNFAPSGQVTGVEDLSTESKGGINSLLVILLIVVVVTNIIIILYFRKNKK